LPPVHLAGFSLGGEVGLLLGMTRPELLQSLVCVGANYSLDDTARAALQFFDAALLERDHPEFAAELARRHDAHHAPGYWRKQVGQIREVAEAALVWTGDDLRRVAVPTLLMAGEADAFNGMEQALAMRQMIPNAETLILNHAGLDGMDNHRVQATRADVVGPVMLDFLRRHADSRGSTDERSDAGSE
jgi:pimeloyl-ACP methyl ester carboxylesterase